MERGECQPTYRNRPGNPERSLTAVGGGPINSDLRHRMLPRQDMRRSYCSTVAIPALVTCTVTGFVEPSVAGTSAPLDVTSNFCATRAARCAGACRSSRRRCRALRCSLFRQWPRRNIALECRAPKNTDPVKEHRWGSRDPQRERSDRTALPGHSRDVRFTPTNRHSQRGWSCPLRVGEFESHLAKRLLQQDLPIPDIQVHAAVCPQMAGFCSTRSGYVSISFMKMNGTR
jgi:hypothetical protein